MNEKLDKAIEQLASKITDGVDSGDALRFTQAALNLAHVKATNAGIKRDSEQQ